MAGFLRKKSNKQPQPTPTPSGPFSIGGPTPLYAKFTSVTTNGRSTGSGGKRKQGTIPREDRDSTTSLLPIQPVPSSSGDHAPVPVDVLSSSPPASTLVTNRRHSRGGGGGAPRLDALIPSEALFSTPKVLTRSTADNQDGSGGSGRHNLQPGSLRGAKGITHELASDPVPPPVLHRSVSTNEPKSLLDEAPPPPPAKQANYTAPVSYAMNGAYPMPIKKLPQHAAPAPVASRKGPLIFAAMVQAEDSYPSPPAEYPLDPVPRFMTRAPVTATPKPAPRETAPQSMSLPKAQPGRTQPPTMTSRSPPLPAHSTSRTMSHSPPQTPPQHIPQQFASPPPSQHGSSSHQVPQYRPDSRSVPVEPPTPQSLRRQNMSPAAPPVAYHHQPNGVVRSPSNARPNGSVSGHGIGISRAPSQPHPNGNVNVNRTVSNARQPPQSQPPNLYPNGAARPSTSNGVVRMPSLTNMNTNSSINGRQAYPHPNGIIRSPSQTNLPSSVTSRTASVLRSPSQTQVHIIPLTPPRAAPSRSPSDASFSHSTRRLMKKHHHHQQQPSVIPVQDDVPYFADDPFAKVEGVRVLPASSVTHGFGEDTARERIPSGEGSSRGVSIVAHSREGSREEEKPKAKVEEEEDVDGDGVAVPRENVVVRPITPEKKRVKTPSPPPPTKKRSATPPQKPLTPPPLVEERPASSPPPPVASRSRSRHHAGASPPPDSLVANVKVNEDQPFPLHTFLADPALLRNLLGYLGWWEWCILGMISQRVRGVLFESKPDGDERREEVLERFLGGVGYRRWAWPDDPEPVRLTVNCLHAYMHGVSLPTHEYARVAVRYVRELKVLPSERDPELGRVVKALERSTRAYTAVVLRLRAQAEKEAAMTSPVINRPPSPTFSTWSHTQSHAGHLTLTPSTVFRSPLVKLRRAPLLRCFVPSPDGDWLSDTSVLRCEAEMDKAGVRGLLRAGDVVWDVAVGDEANLGRMVWDGRYLIDLDYTFSVTGDLPRYLLALAFPPSYFHRVVRGGNNGAGGGPVIRVDLRPWGDEIRGNMQLLQDRVRTETPQGTYHNVVRWVHRSSFQLRARRGTRIPIPESGGLFVDPGWYGTVVVETEGTNESLRDLQERLGIGRGIQSASMRAKGADSSWGDDKMVFRILRERSRPGEIWIRAVGVKERVN